MVEKYALCPQVITQELDLINTHSMPYIN